MKNVDAYEQLLCWEFFYDQNYLLCDDDVLTLRIAGLH